MKKLFFLSMILFCSCISVEKIDKSKITSPSVPKKGDGYIFSENIKHEISIDYAFPINSKSVRLFLETRKSDAEKVDVVFNNNSYEMKSLGILGEKEYYYADVPFESAEYYFELSDRKRKIIYGDNGSDDKFFLKTDEFKEIMLREIYPEWSSGLVWYKILVDSFKNGNKENDPLYNELGKENFLPWSEDEKESLGNFNVSRWNSNFSLEEEWGSKIKKNTWNAIASKRFGGDIKGVEEKLSYLKELGVEIIELTPVFYSNSNNKFDTIDYRHISPDFGVIKQTNTFLHYADSEKTFLANNKNELELMQTNSEGVNGFNETLEASTWKWTESDLIFSEFLKKANNQEMKVIVDVDFRGVAAEFFIFDKVLSEGPDSKYRDWFVFQDWNKVEKITDENIDVWNPYVEYNGEFSYGVVELDGKKYRRKWLSASTELSEREQNEIITWNKENVSYKRLNSRKIKLNLKSESLKDYILESSKKWLKGFLEDGRDSLAGYKVYCNSEDMDFFDEFKAEMLATKEDVLIISNQEENYEYVDKLIKTFIFSNEDKLSLKEFKSYINLINARYSDMGEKVKNYPLDGIYTDRIYSQVINLDREFDRLNKSIYEDSYLEIRPNLLDESSIKKLKLLIALQIFSSSNPYLYYGTEIGMWGGDVPYNRKPMLWQEELPYDEQSDDINKYDSVKSKLDGKAVFDEVQQKIYYPVELNIELLDWYKKLIEIYKKSFIYFRESESKFITVIKEEVKKELPTGREVERKQNPNQGNLTEKSKEKEEIIAIKYKKEDVEFIIVVNTASEEARITVPVEKRKDYTELLNLDKLSVINNKVEIILEANGIALIKQ